ncbi:MAG TPA: hypothetical protein VFS00_33875, partial [Polyangiaceae bacterium]|nr:hypothetical protein [Polyangiaceae bacterium]
MVTRLPLGVRPSWPSPLTGQVAQPAPPSHLLGRPTPSPQPSSVAPGAPTIDHERLTTEGDPRVEEAIAVDEVQ